MGQEATYALQQSIATIGASTDELPDLYVRESFGLFFIFAISLLRKNGRYVFLLPDTFLCSTNHKPLRNFIAREAAPLGNSQAAEQNWCRHLAGPFNGVPIRFGQHVAERDFKGLGAAATHVNMLRLKTGGRGLPDLEIGVAGKMLCGGGVNMSLQSSPAHEPSA
jgi:hypothetical protein